MFVDDSPSEMMPKQTKPAQEKSTTASVLLSEQFEEKTSSSKSIQSIDYERKCAQSNADNADPTHFTSKPERFHLSHSHRAEEAM